MKHFQNLLLTAVLTTTLIGCSNAGTDTTVEQADVEAEVSLKTTEITWEDLMPAGEDELLESLYVEFYTDLEQKMLKNSTSLTAAAREQTDDVSSIIAEGRE